MAKAKRADIRVGIFLLLAAVAVCARFVGNHTLSTLPGLVRSIIYIYLMIVWGLSVRARVIQTQTRRYLTFVCLLGVFWILLRTVKYFFLPDQSLSRPIWYLYYLPMLFIPLLAVFIAVSLGKPESYRTPKKVRMLYIPTALLLTAVLTNDLHRLVFTFPPGKPWSDHDYGYGFLFYLVVGWELLLSIAAFAVMVKRCRFRTLKTAAPLLFMSVSLLYSVLYTLELPWLVFLANDLTVVQCCLFVLIFESCIRCGLIQSNTGYGDLFEACTLGAQITDDRYQIQYASRLAPVLSPEMMRQALQAPVSCDKNTLVKSNPIPGGHVFWKEDITELTALIEELQAAGDELAERNLVERENYKTRRRISALREKNRLLDLVQQQTQAQIPVLDSLLLRCSREQDEEKRRKLLAMTAVVGTYIKRCGNLVFIRESGADAETQELERCLEESFSNLELMGVSCACDLPKNETVCACDAIRAYRIFETVIEAAAQTLDCVWIKGRAEERHIILRIEVSCQTDLSMLGDTADGYTAEDGSCCFTVQMKKGGAQA